MTPGATGSHPGLRVPRGWRAGAVALAVAMQLAGASPATAQNPVAMDTLRVTASSRLSGEVGSVEILTAEELATLPVSTLESALRWATGVDLQARSPAQADLSIRGSSFEQVLVLVDGVRMSDPQTGHFDLDLTVPLDQVARIEILRGPASAIYGADAMGGVVNVVTRDPGTEGTRGSVRGEGGSFGSWGWGGDLVTSLGDWRMSGAASQDVSDGHRDGTDYRMLRGHLRLVGPVGGGRTTLELGQAERDFGAADFYAPYSSYEETRTRTATVRWTRVGAGGTVVEPRVSWRGHDDDFVLQRDDPDFYRNLHDSRQLTAGMVVRLPLAGSGGLALGGEWSRESLESTNLGDREQEWRALFGEAVLRAGAMELQGGLRVDDREDVGSFVSPSASLLWRVHPAASLRAAAGRSFRAPTWTERYYTDPANVGTPDLAVERGWSAEVGGRLEVGTGGVSATLFRRETDDLIDWARPVDAGETVPWETRNVEEARFTGLEVALDGIRMGDVDLRGGASWIRVETEEAEGLVSKSALRPLVRELTLGLRWVLPDESSVHLLAQDRARRGGEGGVTVDARLEGPVGQGTLYLDGRNLTDRRYPDLTGFPIPGRAFIVGLKAPLSW